MWNVSLHDPLLGLLIDERMWSTGSGHPSAGGGRQSAARLPPKGNDNCRSASSNSSSSQQQRWHRDETEMGFMVDREKRGSRLNQLPSWGCLKRESAGINGGLCSVQHVCTPPSPIPACLTATHDDDDMSSHVSSNNFLLRPSSCRDKIKWIYHLQRAWQRHLLNRFSSHMSLGHPWNFSSSLGMKVIEIFLHCLIFLKTWRNHGSHTGKRQYYFFPFHVLHFRSVLSD